MPDDDKVTVELRLPAATVKWLDEMASSHGLSDRSKAARCCINCVALGGAAASSVGDPSGASPDDGEVVQLTLAREQVDWIERQKQKAGGDGGTLSSSDVVARVVGACMGADQQEVFGVVRCTKKIVECDGAQEAVERMETKYGVVKVEEEIKLK